MSPGQDLFGFVGRVALVTGGGGYFGQAIGRALAERGAQVVLADNRRETAEGVAEGIRADGGRARALELDVADEAAVTATIDGIAGREGRLDVLVHTPTWCTGRQLDELTLEEFMACQRVSLGGAFIVSREAGRVMVKQGGGSIVHFSSMYGVVSPDPRIYVDMGVNTIDYGAAKAAILQMTRYQAVMWGAHGVRVNAIIPGPFPHPGLQEQRPDFIEKLAGKNPMGRIGRQEEIVGAAIFLASDAASYVTGTSITVDGGWTAW